MLKTLQKSNLFRGLSLEEIQEFIKNSGATTVTYDKNQILFHMGQKPTHLFVLLKGAIAVCRDSVSGKRMVVTNIDDIGDIFAEVYLFLPKESYDYYSVAIQSPTTVLKIPKSVFQGDSNQHFDKLIANMLLILSQKAYNLTQKLQILASGNLRQKLSKMLLEGMDEDNNLILGLNREQLADYLNVARPSLSRELTNMQAEGLIKVKGRQIKILDPEGMEM